MLAEDCDIVVRASQLKPAFAEWTLCRSRYLQNAMSLDINWSLLSAPSSSSSLHKGTSPAYSPLSPPNPLSKDATPTSTSGSNPLDLLSTTLLQSLNATLQTTPLPSFIGPIHLTSLDFGSNPPDVEIRDIRDVWRVFDEADEEEDTELEQGLGEGEGDYEEEEEEEDYDIVRYDEIRGGDDNASIISGRSILSPRGSMSVASVGLGASGLKRDYTSGLLSPSMSLTGIHHRTPSVISYPHSNSHHHPKRKTQRRPNRPAPTKIPSSTSSAIPSLQLHLRLSHTSDMHLTFQTSLSVNYPSPSFMSLPLKLSITGLTLSAPDLILAFSGERNRIHLCVVDEEGGGGTGGRLLPDLKIESEIGHADAHVLRNVGKVERFIADAVRKTLVDELVFPNFHTIAL
jgi:distribution and morphology protein 12